MSNSPAALNAPASFSDMSTVPVLTAGNVSMPADPPAGLEADIGSFSPLDRVLRKICGLGISSVAEANEPPSSTLVFFVARGMLLD